MDEQKLTGPEVYNLREFVKEVLTVIANDDTGVSHELIDSALRAGEIMKITKDELDEILDRG